MGKASTRNRRGLRKSPGPRAAGRFWFSGVLAGVVALGIAGIALSRGSGSEVGPPVGAHWHAALGINACGQWKENVPEFVSRPGSSVHLGLHSHGDGLIHIEPASSADAHENATLGRFFENGGGRLTGRSIRAWDGAELRNGDKCPNLGNRPGTLRWAVNGDEQQGDPRRYHLKNRDVIALAFLPEGEEIGEPPQAAAVEAPVDAGGPGDSP